MASTAEPDWRVIKSWPEWLIQWRDPTYIATTHASYVAYEYAFYFFAFVALVAAFKQGGRTPFIWVTAVVHGLWLEMLCYYIPDIDNFWQSHSSIMFFGHRYPLHILCLCKRKPFIKFLFFTTFFFVILKRCLFHLLGKCHCKSFEFENMG